jgi:hypothetical protein
MQPPFTTQQFLDVIAQYNDAVWPMQVVLYGLAVILLYWAVRRSGRDRWIVVGLAFLWAWMGVVYHWLFFTSINRAAWIFGAFFVAQAVVFLVAAAGDRLAFRFEADAFGIVGAVFIAYALALYPIIGAVAGHGFPDGPTFGLPCPTTIVTFGLLLWSASRVPWWVLAVPFAWSLVGGSAAFQFGIPEDYGLVAAGVLGTILLVVKNRRAAATGVPAPSAA